MKKRKIVLAGLLTVSLAVPMPVGAAVEVRRRRLLPAKRKLLKKMIFRGQRKSLQRKKGLSRKVLRIRMRQKKGNTRRKIYRKKSFLGNRSQKRLRKRASQQRNREQKIHRRLLGKGPAERM